MHATPLHLNALRPIEFVVKHRSEPDGELSRKGHSNVSFSLQSLILSGKSDSCSEIFTES